MRIKVFKAVFFIFSFLLGAQAMAAGGLIATKSPYSVKKTMDRFESRAKEKGMGIFARIDHAAGAAKVGKSLRPTELLIFGNPKGGTPFMACAQTVGIDLPLKVLVWQDTEGGVWIGYNDPMHIAQRHGANNCPVVTKMQQALNGMVSATIAN